MFPCRDYQCSGLRMISNTAHRTSRFKEKIKIQISCKILHVIVSNFRHLHTQWKLLFCQILNSIIWNFKNKYGGIKDINNSHLLLVQCSYFQCNKLKFHIHNWIQVQYCKSTFICVQENFSRFTRALSMQIFLVMNQQLNACLWYIYFQILYTLITKINRCKPVYLQ